jgi:hypothetical protein
MVEASPNNKEGNKREIKEIKSERKKEHSWKIKNIICEYCGRRSS